MKFKSILATALAAVVALSSCSKEDSGVDPVDGSKARMNLSFTLPQEVKTRADQDANPNESFVETIAVYIFNNGVAAGTGGYTIFDDIDNQFDKAGGVYTLKAANNIQTVSGDMKIYVAINLPTPKAYSTESALLAAYEDVADMSVALKFTMLSAAKSETLVAYDEDDAAATTTSVEMEIDRVVSKLVATSNSATYKATWTGPDAIELDYTIAGYNVYNEATNSFLVEQATTKSTLNLLDASYAKGNKTVAVGAYSQGDASLTALTNGYYIGENNQTPSEYGNTTYAFVATTVTTNKVAKWNTTTKVVDWGTADYSSIKDVFVVVHEDGTYITNITADATQIAAELNTIKPNSATVYTYKGGYVHFMVHLNKNGANDYTIGRNEFIHLKVTGIKSFDGKFPGYPGDGTTPTKPIDPTEEIPGVNPDPIKPTDPVDGEKAVLNVEITMNPWKYKGNEVILQ